MNHFYIITNREKDEQQKITSVILDYLKGHGKKCELMEVGGGVNEKNYH